MSAEDNVLAWQICTGCANTRELLVTLAEARRLQALPIAGRERHDGCYPSRGATRSEWVTNGARAVPDYTGAAVDPQLHLSEQPCRCMKCLREALRQLPRTAYSETAQAAADALLAGHGFLGVPEDWPGRS